MIRMLGEKPIKTRTVIPGIVRSITRSAEIIECLSEGEDRIIDICKRLNLGKSTVHRLLKTLEASGFVARDPINRRYQLGYLLIRIASNQTVMHQNLIINARPEMERLRDISGETVTIQIPIGMQRMWLEELESPHYSKLKIGKGQVGGLYEGTGGKVLLSQFSGNELSTILKNLKLGGMSSLSLDNLYHDIENVRREGYCVRIGEVEGSASVSVPIKNYACPVALNVLGPVSRFTNIKSIIPEMKEIADKISGKLLDVQSFKNIHHTHSVTSV